MCPHYLVAFCLMFVVWQLRLTLCDLLEKKSFISTCFDFLSAVVCISVTNCHELRSGRSRRWLHNYNLRILSSSLSRYNTPSVSVCICEMPKMSRSLHGFNVFFRCIDLEWKANNSAAFGVGVTPNLVLPASHAPLSNRSLASMSVFAQQSKVKHNNEDRRGRKTGGESFGNNGSLEYHMKSLGKQWQNKTAPFDFVVLFCVLCLCECHLWQIEGGNRRAWPILHFRCYW